MDKTLISQKIREYAFSIGIDLIGFADASFSDEESVSLGHLKSFVDEKNIRPYSKDSRL